jgi:hypothetical protein
MLLVVGVGSLDSGPWGVVLDPSLFSGGSIDLDSERFVWAYSL